MIKVLSVNKNGNRIINYTCTDGAKTVDLTKAELLNFIQSGQVVNAKLQVYNGKPIIRVKDTDSIKTSEKSNKVFKINKSKTIADIIQEAKAKGITELPLEGLVVNTVTLEVKKNVQSVKSTSTSAEPKNGKVYSKEEVHAILKENVNNNSAMSYIGNIAYFIHGVTLGCINLDTLEYKDLGIVSPASCLLQAMNGKLYCVWCSAECGEDKKLRLMVCKGSRVEARKELATYLTYGDNWKPDSIHHINEDYSILHLRTRSGVTYIYLIDESDRSYGIIVRDFHSYMVESNFITGYNENISRVFMGNIEVLNITDNNVFKQLTLRNHYFEVGTYRPVDVYEECDKTRRTEKMYYRLKIFKDSRDNMIKGYKEDGSDVKIEGSAVQTIEYNYID